VSGRLRQRSYETKEGEKRTVYEIEADEVGPSLRSASARVTKVSREGGNGAGQAAAARSGGRGQPSGGYGDGDSDPWAADGPGNYSDEPPF
jgi:single-strand DNA-binding protein